MPRTTMSWARTWGSRFSNVCWEGMKADIRTLRIVLACLTTASNIFDFLDGYNLANTQNQSKLRLLKNGRERRQPTRVCRPA